MFPIRNIERIDSPALVVYEETIHDNILLTKEIAGDVTKLRPHVKTHKIREICEMMLRERITKFKCATIAEAEMLAQAGAADILLAYQPVGPKIERMLKLVETYPSSRFSCLIDTEENARIINDRFERSSLTLNVFIDVNIGMNRTGICPPGAIDMARNILLMKHLRIAGLHGYDGHIHDTDLTLRQQAADASFAEFDKVYQAVRALLAYPLIRVLGGTPTFPVHARRSDVECSPGTFVFWDWGYRHLLPDLPFQYAALVVSRVISVIDKHRICLDLGHKSIASENPLPRVHF
ncbi:D-threonine aldolase, partial [termite gut metagenome]